MIFGKDLVAYGTRMRLLVNDSEMDLMKYIYSHTSGRF